MAFPRARIKRFNETNDNIPGVGSYNLLGDHHGPIKDLELNRTRSLNRLDQSGRTYKDIGYRVPDNNEMHRKLKEAQDQIKSLDILLTGANKQKDMSEKNYKVLEQKLSSGEKNLKELESEKNKLNKAISELQKENTDLESKRASAEHESHAISAQLEKEKNIVKNLQKECSSLQSYVCKLQNEVKELESEKIKLAKIISKLENTKANLEKDRDAMSSCLNEEKERYKKECATLMSTITQLQREGKIYDEENNQMDRTIQELVTMIANLEKTKDIIATQLEAERDKSQKELKSSISVLLEESEAEKVKLSSRITELQKETLELGKKLENTEQEFQSVSSQLLEEKSSVSTIKEECSAMNFTILKMENEIADLKTEKINLVQGLSELENVRASLEKDKNGLSSCIEEEREKSKKECSVFMSLITELKQEREQFHPEVVQLKITIDELEKKNASLENDKKAISSQWEFERDKSQIALEESEAEKEKLNAMISEVQKVSLELEKKLEDSVQKCQAISSELKEEKISVSTFKEEYSLMKLAVSSMETELADLKAERTTLVQTMSELENARICLSSRLDEERGISKKDFSILMSTVVELKNDIEYFQVEKNHLNEAINELKMKNTGLEEDRKALSCQLEDEKERAERHVAELLEEKVRLNDIIALLQTESLALKNQLTNSVQECQVLSTQLIEKNVKYLEMKSSISRLDEEVTYLENTKASLEMERDSISSSMMEEREKFHNECSVLTSSILELQTTVTNYEGKNNVLNKTVLELQSKNAHLENDMNISSSQLADEREQFKKECSVLNSSVAELTQKLENCENERSNLNQTIQELKTMIVHLEKDKEAFSSQLEENWKLIEKIEPFRDVLDNFEMEKKLLLERDKYTSEQMERLTKEAIKNMGHQNHRQKVKYVKTLKKIAPVITTTHCDSSKMTQTPGEPRIPFKGKKMLSESECMCPVCISLIILPVTFPCNHSLCLQCYKETVEKANLSCPVCRKRISVWARKAAKENKLINIEKWTDIQEAFPEKVRRRLEASEESNSEDEEDDIEAQEKRQIACHGEIRQEYEAAIQQIRQKKDQQAKKEEEASKVNFEALQQEEFLSENVEIEEKAPILEKKKSKKNSLLLNPVVRLKKCLKAEELVLSWRANNCPSGTETFHDTSQLTENRSAIPAGNSSVKNDDLKFATKLQEFFDLMDRKRIVVDRSKGSSNEYTLRRKHKCDE